MKKYSDLELCDETIIFKFIISELKEFISYINKNIKYYILNKI